MAEDFQSSNWWKTSRSRGRVDAGSSDDYDGASPATSTTIPEGTGAPFAWQVGAAATRQLKDSTLQLSGFGLSSPSMDWDQTLLSSSGRGESSFQAMLQEDLNSRSVFSAAHESSSSSPVQLKHINQPFFFDNSSISGSGFPLVSSTSSTSSIMQGFLENDSRHEQSLFDSQQMFHYQQSQFIQQKHQSAMVNHLQFTNNTPFWNASSFSQPFDLPIKGLEGGQEKKSSSEPALKKIRAETASTLPTFKVRKEKLGDRITALQQLVSPFGKTDTASVLHEAIEYIKFLHDQVLSTPYLKNGHPMQQQQQSSEKFEEGEWQKQDLRSRGLCLVPISSTYPVATETNADFWTPTFGGAYR
ncbi:transcription factor bHLH112-like isoform X2 [Phalaenopsis equestris]|uniref:transcription factor bHLH112-like isoform X2 n=1 Tax=Phalaenopsis equestris TaxID=78828 RepID=UPI0009E28B75|nr:transcription factor bHLH112-like isoform X2 [Phalaenopsis equestris]